MFQEIKISSCNIFLKESFSYISGNENREKLPYISGNKNPKETSYISGNNFPISKSKENPLLKLCLYFGKWNFLATSLKNYFLRRIPQSFSSLVFSGVFIFRHWFLPLFWGCFYCWLHFFHNFAGFLQGTSFLYGCTASAMDFRELFLLWGVFTLHSFLTFATVPQVLRIWESFFLLSVIFYHSFPTFGTIWFYQGLPGTRQFFLEGCRASASISKDRPGLSCSAKSNNTIDSSYLNMFSSSFLHLLQIIERTDVFFSKRYDILSFQFFYTYRQ